MERDSFEQMASGISAEERQNMLERMSATESPTDGSLQPAEEKIDNDDEPIEIKIKHEPIFLRFIIWLKALLSNTSKAVIYNEYKLDQIASYIKRNFPGLIDAKQGLLLSAFYDKLSELKSCADFFKPYLASTVDNDGAFYVFLSTLIMPEINAEIKTNVDPYSNPVTPEVRTDLRSGLLRKMEEIFDNIPSQDRAKMYEVAKATEWLKQFVRLPFSRFITQFSSANGNENTCPLTQVDIEITDFTKILTSAVEIPDEFLEALFMFAVRNSKYISQEESGRDAGEFIAKARSSVGFIKMFMTSVPIRSLGCIANNNAYWHTQVFQGGEDWFVKFKNEWKKIFEQKWIAWETDCKREALLSTLKVNFNLEQFPLFPERPWEDVWGGIPFVYDSTLGFLNWFMKEKFSICELDLKTLLVQGAFNKKENHTTLSDNFNAMVQLSISFQELARRLSNHGETGIILGKMKEEVSRTLQAQNKVEQIMRGIESDVATLIHRFGDASRAILQVLNGVLGYVKDARFDTISNLNKMKDQNNEPFIHKIEQSKTIIENALNFVVELENLDRQKKRN